MHKPVDEPEIITLSDDEDSFDKAHEVLKLLQQYPAIFSNEDSYNKVLQARFHTKINEKDQDGNIIENDTTFQFKSVKKEKLQKNEEEINNEKEHTIQVFDIPLCTEKKTIQNSFSLLGEIKKSTQELKDNINKFTSHIKMQIQFSASTTNGLTSLAKNISE
ncbi:hypothetical protein RclHR1_10880006 [Rhizophagus clarus]|uniref:Uncharacterized protein n=1 Tax=Rhizophagus clarus TaxID=94130 RepID=A0A2Z6QHI4_9GLOM|nr:hypothetical protein RclHR1_10880006 [Rhizophagus clarus]